MTEAAEKMASNVWFALVGRAAMLLVIPILVWMGATLIQVKTDIQILAATVASNMSDRYRADDARRDLQLRDLRITTLETRLQELEHEVRSTKIDVKEQQQVIQDRVAPTKRKQ